MFTNYFLVIIKNQKIFSSEEGEISIEIDQFYKIAGQMQFLFNPVHLLEYFVLSKGIPNFKDTPGK